MKYNRNIKNWASITLLVVGTFGAIYSGSLYKKHYDINFKIQQHQLIKDENFPYLEKFSSAYFQSTKSDYKHSVQTYGQLLELKAKLNLTNDQLAPVQFNIGNNLFMSALMRHQNEDGSLADEARYDLAQAKIAYEQSLKLNPDFHQAKFNLSLLNSVLSDTSGSTKNEQAGVELSNLPIGLP